MLGFLWSEDLGKFIRNGAAGMRRRFAFQAAAFMSGRLSR